MLNQIIDDFYDTLFKPSLGLRRITAERTIWHGLFVYVAVSLVSAITTFGASLPEQDFLELGEVFGPEAAAALLQAWPMLNLMLIIVFGPLFLFSWAAILQFSSELLGGSGRGLQVATAMGYSHLPYLLVVPFALVARYLAFDIIGLVSLVALLWSIIIKIDALHLIHGFTRSRAALAYFLPFLLLIAALFIFLILVGSFLIPIVAEFFPV